MPEKTRNQKFAEARANGQLTFEHNGKKYNTRMAGESDADWKKLMETNANANNAGATNNTTMQREFSELLRQSNLDENMLERSYMQIPMEGIRSSPMSTNATPSVSTVRPTEEQLDQAASSIERGETMRKLAAAAPDVIPFVSNLVNATRRPARTELAPAISAPLPRQIRMSIQPMYDAYRQASRGFNDALSGPSAAIASQNAYAKTLKGIGEMRMQEAFTNARLGSEADQIGTRTDLFNTQNLQAYYDNNTNMQLAHTTQQSANLANAADKMVTLRNRDINAQNAYDQFLLYTQTDPYGTQKRFIEALRKAGINPAAYRLGGPIVRRQNRKRITNAR